MKVLVMGGTRFFGRNLVLGLLNEGARVTLLTTGKTPDPYGKRVARLHALRSDRTQMQHALRDQCFDVVFDQICFSPVEAAIACELFAGRTARYIFTSSVYVYESGRDLTEEAFDPSYGELPMLGRYILTYEQGKRYAEGVFVREKKLPAVCVRLPVVLGYDDYTNRVGSHVSRLLQRHPILVPKPSGRMNYLSAQTAADFLIFMSHNSFTGQINAAGSEELTAEELVRKFAVILGKTAEIVEKSPLGDMPVSLLHRPSDLTVSSKKGQHLGFTFPSIESWLPSEILKAAELVTAS